MGVGKSRVGVLSGGGGVCVAWIIHSIVGI